MRCYDVQKKLDVLIRGELPRDMRAEIEAHAQACPHCRKSIDQARQIAELLRRASAQPAPEGFADRVIARARQKEQEKKEKRVNVLHPFMSWAGGSRLWRAAIAAGLIFGVGIGITMGRATWRKASPQKAPAQIIAQVDVVSTFGMDYLAESPAGSLPDAFVRMVSSEDDSGG